MPKTLETKAPQIDARHPDYAKHLEDWELIEDCIAGQRTIKEGRTKYLPKPGVGEADDGARYNSYLQRAVFLNMTGETQKNLVGQCFSVQPVYSGPEELEALLDSIDGAGVSAMQQSKCALGMVLAFSRAGIFTDYPETSGVVSQADVESGNVAPKVILYGPKQIINWDTIQRGARTLLSHVMIEETYVKDDDGYCKELGTQWRELRLEEDSKYMVKIWRRVEAQKSTTEKKGFIQVGETAYPTDSNGVNFDEIPFDFIGAEANNTSVEKPLLIDIANINVAHFVDSADNQETVHMVGQATPWASGLTEHWIENVMHGKMQLGARGVIPLPENAEIGLLQITENTLAQKAMEQKEDHARKLGAKLVEKREVATTATADNLDEGARTSVLAGVCSNVSEAYKRALMWASRYTGVENKAEDYPQGATYELNTEFAASKISPEERRANREDYLAELIDFEEARENLKSGGVAYKDDEDVKDFHEEKAEEDFRKAQEAFRAQSGEVVPDTELTPGE